MVTLHKIVTKNTGFREFYPTETLILLNFPVNARHYGFNLTVSNLVRQSNRISVISRQIHVEIEYIILKSPLDRSLIAVYIHKAARLFKRADMGKYFDIANFPINFLKPHNITQEVNARVGGESVAS